MQYISPKTVEIRKKRISFPGKNRRNRGEAGNRQPPPLWKRNGDNLWISPPKVVTARLFCLPICGKLPHFVNKTGRRAKQALLGRDLIVK